MLCQCSGTYPTLQCVVSRETPDSVKKLWVSHIMFGVVKDKLGYFFYTLESDCNHQQGYMWLWLINRYILIIYNANRCTFIHMASLSFIGTVNLNPRSGYKKACNMGYCTESQDLARPPRLQGLTWDAPVLLSKCKVWFSLSLAIVAGFYWLAGVGNGSAHLFAPSSAPFVCITKPGRFSKSGLPRIFQREHVTTAFYTRSGGLRVS
jgi:hypothetical protein